MRKRMADPATQRRRRARPLPPRLPPSTPAPPSPSPDPKSFPPPILSQQAAQEVVGQTVAVDAVVEAMLRSRAGLGRPQQPIGSFLFLGPTGVGKTELAKALAEQLFNDENMLVGINMSEYMEHHLVARLIEALPGWATDGASVEAAIQSVPVRSTFSSSSSTTAG